ncbi:MAG: M23 family metallopeptidase [Thermodesulfobacteriota bacterium]
MRNKAEFGAFVTLVVFNLFCCLVYGQEEKFIDPCTDAGGYLGWLGGPNKNHLGHDYNAPAGTKVKAISRGEVSKILYVSSGCYDPITRKEINQYFVWIKHRKSNGDYFYALYSHITPLKKEGDEVKAGEVIGKIVDCHVKVDSDLVSAPHLHFGIFEIEDSNVIPPVNNLGYGLVKRKGGEFVNPLEFLKKNRPYVQDSAWKAYTLGALSYSIPSDWKLWGEGDALRRYYRDQQNQIQYQSLGGIQRTYYTEKDKIWFIISVMDEKRGIESGRVRIVHYDECGGKRIEEPVMMSQRTINITITHMGCLVDSFKTEVAGYPVMVCILRGDRSASSTYWTFNLIRSGKWYVFHLTLTCASPEYQRKIFRQLTSQIRFSS